MLVGCSAAPTSQQDPVVSDATPAQTAETDAAPTTQTVEATQKVETTQATPGATTFHLPPPVMKPELLAAAAGETSVQITGCALDGKEAAPTRSAPMRKRTEDSVTVKADKGAVVVEHFVNHACCLKGAVTTDVTEGAINVRESLTGSACRCMCSSTIKTTVPAHAGTYNVQVSLDMAGNAKTVATQSVTVP
jgi:hypothetical protein